MEQEHADLEARLADPAVATDPAELRTVTRRYHELTPVVAAARRQRALLADAEAARELLTQASGDERELLEADLATTTLALDVVAAEARRADGPRLTRTPGATSSSRSAAPRAGRRPTSSPATCTTCISPTQGGTACAPRLSPPMRAIVAATTA